VDVLIIGAGLSGIGAARHLQRLCPTKTYAILEARDRLGGTWDLFRYPGIRSDSDMYTLGYSFKPWTDPKAIADGPSILAYIRETADENGITDKIHFNERVTTVRWSSAEARWTVEAASTWTCSFLYVCAGYYDYAAGYTPELPGRERFAGRIVHPQLWPDDLDYAGKHVVVIGSGATAVTLVPELAKQAAHVTMLQRSPTYIMTRPSRDKIADWLRAKLPAKTAYSLTRWKNVLLGMAFFTYARRFPAHAKNLLVEAAAKLAGDRVPADPHLTPSYNPWDQRLCLVPDGDLFEALRAGTADIVTDQIETFTEHGIRLRSGTELPADLVVTATGLKLQLFGGASLEVDGQAIRSSDVMIYKGLMCSGVPNFAFAVGYTNASWTLKVDLTSTFVCRLIQYMDKHHHREVRPRRDPSIAEIPLLDFSSGYVTRSLPDLPRQGERLPWRLYQNYALDRAMLGSGKIADSALEFR
jgi:cation diffusion facilitator CzcD-associated flavoprotein CzcO